eukprot:m.86262 g.86262  ORF g.86262 m.86262 type:complete len:568 (-) comp13544_c1_seq1:31-1734(-)
MAESAIVWEGSPLHQYLEEVNLAARAQPFPVAPAPSRSHRLLQSIRFLISSVARALPRGLDVQAASYSYAKQIAESSQLLVDDVNILRSLDPKILTNPPLTTSFFSSRRAWCLLLAGPTLFAALFLYKPNQTIPAFPTTIFRTLSALPLLFSSLTSGYILLRGHQHTCNTRAVTELTNTLLALEVSIARAIRFTQEIELVSRGYALSAYHLPPISRLEAASHARKCPLLRQVTWAAMRQSIEVFRAITLQLRTAAPLCESADHAGYYLACAPPGPTLSPSDDVVRAATLDYSLASIKAFFTLWAEYRSETLRRVCLACSCEVGVIDDDNNQRLNALFSSLPTLLAPAIRTARKGITLLDRQLSLDMGIRAPSSLSSPSDSIKPQDNPHASSSPAPSPPPPPFHVSIVQLRSSVYAALACAHAAVLDLGAPLPPEIRHRELSARLASLEAALAISRTALDRARNDLAGPADPGPAPALLASEHPVPRREEEETLEGSEGEDEHEQAAAAAVFEVYTGQVEDVPMTREERQAARREREDAARRAEEQREVTGQLLTELNSVLRHVRVAP